MLCSIRVAHAKHAMPLTPTLHMLLVLLTHAWTLQQRQTQTWIVTWWKNYFEPCILMMQTTLIPTWIQRLQLAMHSSMHYCPECKSVLNQATTLDVEPLASELPAANLDLEGESDVDAMTEYEEWVVRALE